jgi:hypothetical protein
MLILRKIVLVNVVLILFYISGCSSDHYATYHKSQDIDFSFVKKVAVMPLENLTDEKSAGDKSL